MTDEQRRALTDSGIGITNLVARATARASELGRDELRQGGERLAGEVARIRPTVVAVAGVTAYRDAFGDPGAGLGWQPAGLAGAALWVVPNPSGLNAHETVESLAGWYRDVAQAAGIG
jgi:TDG/mug DNA glycosylase family protein